jgi:hypothetical protein
MKLGNEKPAFLALSEKALWRALLQASITGDAPGALNTFFSAFQDLEVRHITLNRAIDWYSSNCKQKYYIS